MKKIRFVLELLIIILVGYIVYISADDITSYIDKLLEINEDITYTVIFNEEEVSDDEVKELEDSGVRYEKKEFNASLYPYFDMLNENEKELYNQLYANVEALKNTFVPNNSVNIDEVKKTIESFYNDHPEFFWLDSSFTYKYINEDEVVQIILTFNDTVNEIDKNKLLFEEQTNKILTEANNYATNYEKEKYIHDVLIKLNSYIEESSDNQSAFSALILGNTVCAGYTRAFQYLLTKLNIPTYYVTGIANNTPHAWNIVLLNDGYYNVDVTWDDGNKNNYTYFNLTDEDMSKTHVRNNLSVNLPKCEALYFKGKSTLSLYNIDISLPLIE